MSRCGDGIEKQASNRRIPAAFGLTTASMPSFYRTPASNVSAPASSRRGLGGTRDGRMLQTGLNEEKVNNLVCDIKDAGATISDILDEMQALKMFLNEEDGTTTSGNLATGRASTNVIPESTLLTISNDNLFPWQLPCSSITTPINPINTSWDLDTQDNNARTTMLANISRERLNDENLDNTASPSKPNTGTRSESFKNKLKEELARTISATLQEIHPYSNRVEEDTQVTPVSYTSANPDRVPSMR
jgi:hypothetical protein